ncbi:probable inactive nicotinamidase At3g16190 [Typha angustifolia]|uniref:probable inactive nicotinamidase At3g16190 n=1 Tax=Typha angustifolia TaxID=59011 RepID=UPI003C2C07F5
MVLIIPFPFPSTKSLLPFRNPNRNSITRRPTCPMSANLPRFSALPHHPHQNRTRLSNPLARGDLDRTITKIQAAEISRDVMGVAKWSETAMLVIDMQNDFILPESPLCVAGGDAIVPSVIRAVQVARERGILVIWVVREHDHLGRDVEQFRRHFYTDGKGAAVKASKGAELVDGLLIEERDYKLVKTRFSAFFATHLDLLLRNCGINKLVVAGIQTPNCIRQTVFDAVSLDYQHITVISDATAAASPEIHLANLTDMKNIGVATPTLQEWCSLDT